MFALVFASVRVCSRCLFPCVCARVIVRFALVCAWRSFCCHSCSFLSTFCTASCMPVRTKQVFKKVLVHKKLVLGVLLSGYERCCFYIVAFSSFLHVY